jgi:hypothetical protein
MDTVPSGHHTWAELLTRVDAVRRLAFELPYRRRRRLAESGTHTATTTKAA